MVRVGIAGIGFMGVTHYKALQQVEGAKVSAIFTRNPQKLAGDWRGVKGNFGGASAPVRSCLTSPVLRSAMISTSGKAPATALPPIVCFLYFGSGVRLTCAKKEDRL